jgi:hypothetical protein
MVLGRAQDRRDGHAVRAQDRFLGSRTVVVTGERAEEIPSRARYAKNERHRMDTRDGTRRRRLDQAMLDPLRSPIQPVPRRLSCESSGAEQLGLF